jgi:branched-chain amino acid transport system substrate-binding protein
MLASRDRAYVVTLVLTLVAICAFGVFVVEDYHASQIQASTQPTLVRVGSAGAPDAGLATPGADSTPVSGAGSNTTTTTSGGGGTTQQPPPGVGGQNGNQKGCQNGVIKLGQIVPITGPVTQKTAAYAVQSYFAKVNGQGGINGCKVSFTYLDDGGLDQQKAASDARELVQEDGVFALVGNVQPVTTASTAQYFIQQGVPVVGIEGVGINEYNNPVEYSFAESPEGFGISTANFAHAKFAKPGTPLKVAIFYLDFDFGHASYNAFAKQVAKNGDTITKAIAENISSEQYGTDTLSVEQSNPDVVVNIMDANSVVREFTAMEGNHYYPNLVGTTSSSDPVVNNSSKSWLDHAGHAVYTQRNYEQANSTNPEVQEWISTEGRYFPAFDQNSYAEGAWLGAKVFTEVATRLGGNLTRNNLLAALDALHNYHTGFTPDLTMTSDHGPNRQVIWLQWDGSSAKYQQISGWQSWCVGGTQCP